MATKTRKLNAHTRAALGSLAWARFISPELREKEQKAKTNLIEAVFAGARLIPTKDLELLRKYGGTTVYTRLRLPAATFRRLPDVEHTLPSGKVVAKKAYQTLKLFGREVSLGLSDERFHRFEPITKFLHRPLEASSGDTIEFEDNGYELPDHSSYNVAEIEWASYGEAGKGFKVDQVHPLALPDEEHVKEAAALYYEANEARVKTEHELRHAIISFIQQATTFEEVVEFWPEARELEGKLYPIEKPAPTMALTTLNADVKAKLCASMKKRGVESVICKVAA